MSKQHDEKSASRLPREEQIRLAAYYIWKENGEKNGTDVACWLQAEERVCGVPKKEEAKKPHASA